MPLSAYRKHEQLREIIRAEMLYRSATLNISMPRVLGSLYFVDVTAACYVHVTNR